MECKSFNFELKFGGNELKVIGKILKFSLKSPCL
jgi:hypothetical protein